MSDAKIIKQEKSKFKFFLFYLIISIKWKSSIDEAATFLEGGKLPCLLVQIKVDLLDNSEEEDAGLQ